MLWPCHFICSGVCLHFTIKWPFLSIEAMPCKQPPMQLTTKNTLCFTFLYLTTSVSSNWYPHIHDLKLLYALDSIQPSLLLNPIAFWIRGHKKENFSQPKLGNLASKFLGTLHGLHGDIVNPNSYKKILKCETNSNKSSFGSRYSLKINPHAFVYTLYTICKLYPS